MEDNSRRSIKNKNIKIGELLGGLSVLLLFVAAGYATQNYGDYIREFIGEGGVIGLMLYVVITIVAIVIAPVTTLPLLPIAVSLWGVIPAALLTIIGWTVGAVIAYSLSKKYGRKFVGRIANLEKAQRIADVVSGDNPFWIVVLLRMVIPVDVLSYGLGLVLDMRMRTYALATLIGITPFAFVFAYASALPILYQVVVIIVAVVTASLGYFKIRQAVGKLDSPR